MPYIFEGSHPNKMYVKVLTSLFEYGEKISPRGMETYEFPHPVVNLWHNPSKMVITVPGRRVNPFFTIFEAMWILAGRGDPESLSFYNKNILNFMDEGYASFHAPYGRRIRLWGKEKEVKRIDRDEGIFSNSNRLYRDQFKDAYMLLKEKPDTRQCVIVLWNPALDNSKVQTNDRPCNDAIAFKVRNGNLNMTVFNRSNDLHWGLYSTNVMQFSMMQRILASALGLEVGQYWHHSDSLHAYTSVEDITDRIFSAGYEFDIYDHMAPYYLKNEYSSLEDFDGKLHVFMKCEEMLRDSKIDVIPRTYQEEVGNFLTGVAHICLAYRLHKQKKYEESSEQLMKAHSLGLEDHAVSGMEFVCRKLQKIGRNDLVERYKAYVQNDMVAHFLETH